MTNLLYIGNKLSKKGKNVTSIETLGNLLEVEGFTIKTASSKSNKFLRLADMLYHVLKYKNETDFVLIDTYSTFNFYYALFVSQLCRFLRLKYIPVLRGGSLPERLKSHPKLSKFIFNSAFKNVIPSQYIKSSFMNLGYSNLICIPNSIEIKNYTFKHRNFDKCRLFWVRSFSEIYNPLLAIKILKALQDEFIEATLTMVGPDGDGMLEKARNLARVLEVEVTFTGKLSKREWIKQSEASNIFINTTNFDNMPVSVIEAMALGLPVISTNVGGMPFLIEDRQDGLLVEPDSVKAFTYAIKEIIYKPTFANTISLNARQKVEHYDWQDVKHQWIELLQ